MRGKLSLFERRMEILSILRHKKIVKRCVLAQEFSVSNVTISDDLVALSRYAPICTKTGPYGGIYLCPDYSYSKEYLSNEEIELLNLYLHKAQDDEVRIFRNILLKFSMPKAK